MCCVAGVPLAAGVTEGQASEVRAAASVLAGIRIAGARGRPLTRPRRLLADRGYDARALRRDLRERGVRAVIPERKLPEGKRRRRRGRPSVVTEEAYRRRAIVEQVIGWLWGVPEGSDAVREIGRQLPRDGRGGHVPQAPQDVVIKHSLVVRHGFIEG